MVSKGEAVLNVSSFFFFLSRAAQCKQEVIQLGSALNKNVSLIQRYCSKQLRLRLHNFAFVYIFMQENVFNQTSLRAIANQFRGEIKEHNVTVSQALRHGKYSKTILNCDK